MNDNDDNPRKMPPVEHQFKKGKSGNPRGRPRKRVAGLYTTEVTRAILLEGSAEIAINTSEGAVSIPAFQAVLRSVLKSALSGRVDAQRLFLEKYEMALSEYQSWNPCARSHIEEEKKALSGEDTFFLGLDDFRRKSRAILSENLEPKFPALRKSKTKKS